MVLSASMSSFVPFSQSEDLFLCVCCCCHVDVWLQGLLLYDLGISVSSSDLPNVYALINTDGKGGVELEDFCTWWRSKSKFARLSEEQLQRVTQCAQYFAYFDSDRSGAINSKEVPALFQDLSRNRLVPPGVTVDDMWQALDKDKNGVVTLNEFIDWMDAASYH